jgi:hypothetical protein
MPAISGVLVRLRIAALTLGLCSVSSFAQQPMVPAPHDFHANGATICHRRPLDDRTEHEIFAVFAE